MLRVELLEKIRDERRFDTLEELRAQIEKDREYILKLKSPRKKLNAVSV